jgi:hypothetical protein
VAGHGSYHNATRWFFSPGALAQCGGKYLSEISRLDWHAQHDVASIDDACCHFGTVHDQVWRAFDQEPVLRTGWLSLHGVDDEGGAPSSGPREEQLAK